MKVGIVGLGHLGKIHLKLLSEIPEIEVAGLYDIDDFALQNLSSQYGYLPCNSYADLLKLCDAVIIVTPTHSHFTLAKEAIVKGKHVFLEKPSTYLVEETQELKELSLQHQVLVQVGHIERFNPAFTEAQKYINSVCYIKAERLAKYNIRGTEVSVVMDLMIHDIDLVLSMVDSEIISIIASGKKNISELIDEATATIEFKNKLQATFIVNRAATQNVRKLTIQTNSKEIVSNLLLKELHIRELNSQATENHAIKETNALKIELESFLNSIKHQQAVKVNLFDAEKALIVVKEIENQISKNTH